MPGCLPRARNKARVVSRGAALFWLAAGGLLAVVLAACAAPPQAAGPVVWIDGPLPGAHLPLAPYDVVAHASSPIGVALFELSVDGVVVRKDTLPSPAYGQTLAHLAQGWTPPGPGTYVIAVRAADVGGVFGPADEIRVIVGGTEQAASTATAVPSPTTTPTPTVPASPLATALENAHCRSGDSQVFEPEDSFLEGQTAPVLGRNGQSTWIKIVSPVFQIPCWVARNLVELNVPVETLPVLPSPPRPTPTHTPTPCFGFAGACPSPSP